MEVEVFESGFEVENIEIGDVKRKVEDIVDNFISQIKKQGLALNATESIDYVAESLEAMETEAPDWVKFSTVANYAMNTYYLTKPFECILGYKVVCSGSSVSCNDGVKVVYECDRAPAFSPENFKHRYGHYPRIWRIEIERGQFVSKELVLEQDRIGRAKGRFGWDKYKKLVAAALCSFRHNYEQTLVAFAKYARAPLKKVWVLPNIIPSVDEVERRVWHAVIKVPPCFCPPAVIRYRTKFPWLSRVLVRIGFYNPSSRSASVDLEVWRYDKSERARVKDIEIPPGNSELRVKLKCSPFSIGQRIDISNGYVVVSPYDADCGVSVTYTVTEPKSVYSVKENMYKDLRI